MTKNTPLTTFLMLSVIAILMGIIMVIVTQFENNQTSYFAPVSFEQEQSNIIEQVYKIRASQIPAASPLKEGVTTKPNPASPPLSNEVAQSLQAQVDNYQPRVIPTPRLDNAYNMWNTNPDQQVIEPYYSLKNNPWSPEYQPGY